MQKRKTPVHGYAVQNRKGELEPYYAGGYIRIDTSYRESLRTRDVICDNNDLHDDERRGLKCVPVRIVRVRKA